jgi:hypothetical protein
VQQAILHQLAFSRDMIHNIEFKENRNWTQKSRLDLIDKSNTKENKSCKPYEYKSGGKVLLKRPEFSGLLTHCKNGKIQIQIPQNTQSYLRDIMKPTGGKSSNHKMTAGQRQS